MDCNLPAPDWLSFCHLKAVSDLDESEVHEVRGLAVARQTPEAENVGHVGDPAPYLRRSLNLSLVNFFFSILYATYSEI
jgi:hypothetical protein